VIKILQGGKPADIPVSAQQVRVGNQSQTAKVLDLRIAENFLLRADRVIE
jgi:hypothetical protein